MKILKKPGLNPFDHFPAWCKLSRETRFLFLDQIVSNLKIPASFPPKGVQELYPQKTEPLTETLLQINHPKDLAPSKRKCAKTESGSNSPWPHKQTQRCLL